MDEKLKENIKSQSTWMRGLYMLLFALIYSIAEIVVLFIAVFQFVLTLFTGKVNERLLNFSGSLSTFIYQTMLFFMFNSEEKPYPFSPWPKGAPKTYKSSTSKEKRKPKSIKEEDQ
ncbi:MAG: DUF4389 domain-containing protein [Deltaproteobacteria bacterium]|nr:DUF4389 domain-containing protein [Deltaproteobacteria bacterium]